MKSSFGGLLVLFAVTCAAYMCNQGARAPMVDVAWDGNEYITAWRKGSTIYVQRGAAQRVLRGTSTESEPTIAAVPDGFVVVANRKGHDPPWRGVAIALDARARVKRTALLSSVLSADRQCRVSRAFGEPVAVGFTTRIESAYWIGVEALDRQANQLQNWMFLTTDELIECVLASRERVFAMVTREYGGGTQHLSLTFLDVKEPSTSTHAIENVSTELDWHVSLVPAAGTSWAVLYRKDDRARVKIFNRARELESFELPFEVNQTADLGVNARGLFVAWLDGRTLHVRGVTGGQDHRARVAKDAGIRATGHDDECAVAVRIPDSNRVTIERFPGCL
jgi:hypothetical protein